MNQRIRRAIVALAGLIVLAVIIFGSIPPAEESTPVRPVSEVTSPAKTSLEALEVKGRAPKTNYSRDQFGSGWSSIAGCDSRNIILHRDLEDIVIDENCSVISGTLHDSYTGKTINFIKGESDIQIDHVVALSDAWQKGAQSLTRKERIQLANDPLELIAVDGAANQQKSDGDAATWLPSNKGFRCEYIARQIAVKQKYTLWVTVAEKKAMEDILSGCPEQLLPAK